MAHTKEIRKVGKRDFEVRIDGDVLCYTSTMIEAIEAANAHITALVELEARAVAEDSAAPVAAPAAPSLANVTRENVAAVVARAKAAAAEHTRWVTAITRAADELNKNQWLFTGSTLKIHSRTRRRTYTVSGNDCTCEAAQAGQPCYHVAAWRILTRAAAQVGA
jgi:predicted extracellular nuclease